MYIQLIPIIPVKKNQVSFMIIHVLEKNSINSDNSCKNKLYPCSCLYNSLFSA